MNSLERNAMNSNKIKRTRLRQGFIQVYTGNGKGKTTAAIGLTMRALGAGLQVYFVQFMKNFPYSELSILQAFQPQLQLKRFGNDAFVFKKQPPSEELIIQMKEGLNEALRAMLSREFDVVVLDEVLVSIYFKIFTTDEILQFILQRPPEVELILTGRYCPEEIIERADLVTEMKEIKHYYQQGILARRGIES